MVVDDEVCCPCYVSIYPMTIYVPGMLYIPPASIS